MNEHLWMVGEEMKVKDVMTKEVVSVDKDEDLSHVLDLMKKHNITKIPVVQDKKCIGIVTDNIIALKLGSIRKRDISTSRLHASSVTEKDIITVTSDTDVKKILKDEVGKVFTKVLEDAGVFKRDQKGTDAFKKCIKSFGFIEA